MTTTHADPEPRENAENLAGAVWDLLAGENVDIDYLRKCCMMVIGSRADYRLKPVARDLAFATLESLQDQTPESRDRLAKASRSFEQQRLNRT